MKRFAMLLFMFLMMTTLVLADTQPEPVLDFYGAYYEGLPFRAWPIEVQHQFAQELPGVIAANRMDGLDPYVPDSLWQVMAHTYGLPGPEDLTQAEATDQAMAYITQLGGDTPEVLAGYTWTYSFLTNDSANPQWLVTVYGGVFTAVNRLYRLLIPARGDDITLLFNHRMATPDPYQLLEDFAFANLPQNMEDWSQEHEALYGDMIVQLRETYPKFDPLRELVVWGRPREQEVGYDAALAYANDVLAQQHGGPEGWTEAAFPLFRVTFVRQAGVTDEPRTPYWDFVFVGDMAFYQITVYAGGAEPELLKVYLPGDENG